MGGGLRNPHDILSVLGATELQKYMVNEVQEVYSLQGVNLNEIGDTEFLPEEVEDCFGVLSTLQRFSSWHEGRFSPNESAIQPLIFLENRLTTHPNFFSQPE